MAEADKIRPLGAKGDLPQIRSILPTEFDRDLGQQIWRVAFDGMMPILEFNKNIPNIRTMAKSEPDFFFFVYPQVIREIL